MKTKKNTLFCMLLMVILASACHTASAQISAPPVYKPESKELYDEIVRMDSVWEDSYNHCKMDV